MMLKGKKILVTRAKAQASALSLQIKENGGIPVELPLITCNQLEDKNVIRQTITMIHTYDWIVFTSKNGIDFFMKEYQDVMDTTTLPCKIAVVGKKTEDVLTQYHLQADLIPNIYVAESLLKELLKVIKKDARVLIPHGNLARDIIPEGLRNSGIKVDELCVYETVIERNSKDQLYIALKNRDIDIITFTSSSTVDNFVQLLDGTDWRNFIENVMFASIGPITSKTMLEHGLPVHVEPEEYTLQGMLDSILETLKEEKTC